MKDDAIFTIIYLYQVNVIWKLVLSLDHDIIYSDGTESEGTE